MKAIQEAIQGRTPFSHLAGGVLAALWRAAQIRRNEHRGTDIAQKEILQLIAEGKSPKEIAALLNVSPRTVEFQSPES